MFVYTAKVIGVVDGDTVKLDVDLGFKIRHQVTVRLARINCEEVRGVTATQAGVDAKNFLTNYLTEEDEPGSSMAIVKFTSRHVDKYGRCIGEIELYDQNLSDLLVKEGHAKYV